MSEEYKEEPVDLSLIPPLAYVNGDIAIFRPADEATEREEGWFSIFSEQRIDDERVRTLGRFLDPSTSTSPADAADGWKSENG